MSSKERQQLELNVGQNTLEVFGIVAIALFTRCHPAVSPSFVAQIDDPPLLSNPHDCAEIPLPFQAGCQVVHPPAERGFFVKGGLSASIDLMRQVKITHHAVKVIEQQEESQQW